MLLLFYYYRMEPNAKFRAEVQAAHSGAFKLAADISYTIGDAVIRRLIMHDDVARSVDVLMQQSWKAHASVYILAERSYIEDAAAICRRLLELSIQAAYIVIPEEHSARLDRARRFMARLWHSSPKELHAMLSVEERKAWETWFESCKNQLPDKPRSWWPTFKDMFTEIGCSNTYEVDYRFLSSVAHGSSSFLVCDYAGPIVEKYSQMNISVILTYASRYLIAVAECWNGIFKGVESEALKNFTRLLTKTTA